VDWFAKFPRTRGRPEVARLGVFDSPIGTSINNVACVVGLISATSSGILLLATVLPGASRLPVAAFVAPFVLMFPIALWAVVIQHTLIRWERERTGAPGPPLGRYVPGSSVFKELPKGYLRAGDKVAMGLGVALAFAAVATTPTSGVALPSRPLLGVSFAFTTGATLLALAEHRRRKGLHLQGVLAWPAPPVPAPRLARSRSMIAWLLVTGAALGAIGGTVTVVRGNAYQYDEPRLVSNGSTTVPLPGGDDVIFVGNLLEGASPPFSPSQVTIVSIRTGARVAARWDPSTDHNSPDAIPSLGVISFTAPTSGEYRITIAGPPGVPLFVSRSPGAEARLLAGWIALWVAGAAVALFGVVCLLIRVSWRYRTVSRPAGPPRTIEQWMSESDAR